MLVSQEDIERVTQYSRVSDIEKWLKRHGVAYWTAKKGKVVTTTEAINKALISSNESTIEFK
ncbi:DUF4224 domain-containing protein [Pleionea sediminis]|uniref:DUF4224 domain-containing protein n=1 Tax=Pleionea sediminis TaxID=2569479 RepID=UPI001184F309|nr:DUF4224 domain-containing protein [Pleionea sediminis]